MPHICTRCNNIFQKGDDILKGCPICGWKKFLFTRKVSEEMSGAAQSSFISKAMGVRIPPGPEALPMNELRDSLAVTSASKKDILQPTQQSAQEQSTYKQESTQVDTKETEAKGNSKV